MKKIVVASDSFKGSLSSMQVADAVERAVLQACPACDVIKIDVADGGEGTMDALQHTLGGHKIWLEVSDPLGRPVRASYVILEDGTTAVVEMAVASGLPSLSPEERNPLETSTYGTGQLIADALNKGCRKFLIGIGGSATNDAGMGMLQALGYRFTDAQGNVLCGCGESLEKVASIDASSASPALKESEFIVACDVDAPLYGPKGAAYVFAPQKGADTETVERLDNGLKHFSEVVAKSKGAIEDYAQTPGAGAAGGLGFGLMAFLNARLVSGINMVLDAIGFDSIIKDADLIITGEGRIDSQTLTGKTPYGVLQRAKLQGIPVVAIGGSVQLDSEDATRVGFAAVLQVTPPGMPLHDAMNPETASENICRTILSFVTQSTIE
jgi:glycerate kinase